MVVVPRIVPRHKAVVIPSLRSKLREIHPAIGAVLAQ
jgi:hypothetical protein